MSRTFYIDSSKNCPYNEHYGLLKFYLKKNITFLKNHKQEHFNNFNREFLKQTLVSEYVSNVNQQYSAVKL